MHSLWNDEEAARYPGELGLRVYTSLLLGRDKSLVLHGGGNTSVKVVEPNLVGEMEQILYVKGSGWDLATIEEAGFSPVRMTPLLKLARLKTMTDAQMENELNVNMKRADAPNPSVETILHALLPYKYVDHTHADAVISITNCPDGLRRIQDIYGGDIVIIPYIMPGFDLARLCAERFPRDLTAKTIGMVLLNHGVFSFGETAKLSYERMIDLVSRAEAHLKQNGAWEPNLEPAVASNESKPDLTASFRNEISSVAGFPVILATQSDSCGLAFARRADVSVIAQQGPATPDHVIRTKRLPLVGRDVRRYAQEYRSYFEEYDTRTKKKLTMLDPAPRVVLDPELGICTVGRTARDASIVAEIYKHTVEIILRSTALGGWCALSTKDIFDVEYWELEQAKLAGKGIPPVLAGEIALVTGAASGIGKACTEALLKRGAAVAGLDINPAIRSLYARADFLGVECDLTRRESIPQALQAIVSRFGGLDMLIVNAGIFPPGCLIADTRDELWRKVMGLNLDANLMLLRECHPLLKLAPRGGRVVIIGSKNVPAPGPGAAAYSASKAAMNQLARVAALEWGKEHIRVNSIHPNQVFDTGLWTPEVLESRARHYGLTVQEYKTNNVLRVEIKSVDVAEMAAEMCGPLF